MSTGKLRARQSYYGMRRRCLNPKDPGFANYGGRGITICSRWLKSFQLFYEDMGARPKGKWLGRIDNNGNYEPRNCRWETPTQQLNNTRRNIMVRHNGSRVTMAECAKTSRMNYGAFYHRLRRGWSVKKASSTPVGIRNSKWKDWKPTELIRELLEKPFRVRLMEAKREN